MKRVFLLVFAATLLFAGCTSLGKAAVCEGKSDAGPELNKTNCYFFLAKETGDEKYCGMINLRVKYGTDRCLAALAYEKNDTTLCDKIEPQKNPDSVYEMHGSRPQCITAVAVKTRNSGMCEKLDGSDRLSCRYEVTLVTKDASLCDRDYVDVKTCECVTQDNFSKCLERGAYGGVWAYAAAYGNESACEKDDPLTRDSCIEEVAFAKNDSSVCVKDSEERRAKCEEAIKKLGEEDRIRKPGYTG